MHAHVWMRFQIPPPSFSPLFIFLFLLLWCVAAASGSLWVSKRSQRSKTCRLCAIDLVIKVNNGAEWSFWGQGSDEHQSSSHLAMHCVIYLYVYRERHWSLVPIFHSHKFTKKKGRQFLSLSIYETQSLSLDRWVRIYSHFWFWVKGSPNQWRR